MHTKGISCLLLALLACSPNPGVLEGGLDDEAGSTSSEGTSTDGTSSEGSDASTSEGESSEGLQPSLCESCSPDEMCVAEVLSDLCFEGFNYELSCITRPDACELDPCAPDCLLAACGEGYQCVPECSSEPVDLWCSINSFMPVSCDLATQDCAEGEKCVPIVSLGAEGAYDAAICVSIEGDAQPGEACVMADDWHDDCALGSYCTAAAGQVGVCQGLCDGEGACADGEGCLTANEGLLPVCLPLCDAQDMCPAAQSCTQGDAALVCVPSPSQQGSSCETLPSCSSGFSCVTADALPGCASAACCTAFCDVEDANACAGLEGLSCVPFYEQGMAPAGFETLGLCIAA
jgi:hypothetical protein